MSNKQAPFIARQAREKVERLKRELDDAKAELAFAYRNRYPDGRFIICRNHKDSETLFELWYEKGSPTYRPKFGFQYTYQGFIEKYDIRINGDKTTYYDSLEKMLAACERFDIPKDLVEAFVECCKENSVAN